VAQARVRPSSLVDHEVAAVGGPVSGTNPMINEQAGGAGG
jgi:hypothetical protein